MIITRKIWWTIESCHRTKNAVKHAVVGVVGDLGTVSEGFEKELRELKIGRRIETIRSIALLGLGRLLRGVQEIWRNLSLEFLWKPTSKCWYEKFRSCQIIMTRPSDRQQKMWTCRFGWPLSKTKIMRKERWVPRPCLRTEKKNKKHESDGKTNFNWNGDWRTWKDWRPSKQQH